MAESLEEDHRSTSPITTSDLLASVLGPGLEHESVEEPKTSQVARGSSIEVRTRYLPGQWAPGYEVVEALSSGYRVRRKGSRDVLTEVFGADDVRVASLTTPESPPNPEGRSVMRFPADRLESNKASWVEKLEKLDLDSIIASNSVLRLGKTVTEVALSTPPGRLLRGPLTRLGGLTQTGRNLASGAITAFLEQTDRLMRKGENFDDGS